MNISPVNNNYNPNFKGAYRITIPKSAFLEPENELAVQTVFNDLLRNALKKVPRTFKEKAQSVFNDAFTLDMFRPIFSAQKNEKCPKVLDFFRFPGYRRIQDVVSEQGKSMNWLESHFQYRYNFDLRLPETLPNDFRFFLLSNSERDAFLREQKFAPGLVTDFSSEIEARARKTGVKYDSDDVALTRKVCLALFERNVFSKVTSGNITEMIAGKLTDLPDYLNLAVQV